MAHLHLRPFCLDQHFPRHVLWNSSLPECSEKGPEKFCSKECLTVLSRPFPVLLFFFKYTSFFLKIFKNFDFRERKEGREGEEGGEGARE